MDNVDDNFDFESELGPIDNVTLGDYMQLTITINLDNAAFAGAAREPELARILDKLTQKLAGELDEMRIFDSNGNKVGVARVLRECPLNKAITALTAAQQTITRLHRHAPALHVAGTQQVIQQALQLTEGF